MRFYPAVPARGQVLIAEVQVLFNGLLRSSALLLVQAVAPMAAAAGLQVTADRDLHQVRGGVAVLPGLHRARQEDAQSSKGTEIKLYRLNPGHD